MVILLKNFRFGQFLLSLLPDSNFNEKLIDLNTNSTDTESNPTIYTIKLRNKLILLIEEILTQGSNERSTELVFCCKINETEF